MGGQIVVYSFFKEGNGVDDPILLCTENVLEAFRPVVGSELTLSGLSNTLYRVVRVEPSNNPTDNPNKYFLVVAGSVADGFERLRLSLDKNEITL